MIFDHQFEAVADALAGLDDGAQVQVFGVPERALRLGEALCDSGAASAATVVYHVDAKGLGNDHFVCMACGCVSTDTEA